MSRARESGNLTAPAHSTIYQPANWLDLLDWTQVFPKAQPVEIDIGSGKGGYLLWAAQTKPGINFLGIERQLIRLRKVDKKILRFELTNARQMRCEASYLVGKLIPAGSVAAYHIYFPDPWPKRRHHSRRVFQPEFIRDLHRTLAPGGVVHAATDDPDYFEYIQKVMRASGLFTERSADSLPVEAQTEFEKIFLAQGKKIGRAKYLRS
ncbi:MAG: tRNA (guanosine(46)-N7)-methyltransferase TrmB [Verrucomicrobiota bacterium]